MKRKLWISTLAVALIPLLAGAGSAQTRPERLQPKLVPVPNHRFEPEVRVWTDLGHGGTAFLGESVRVFFQTDRDAYVVVANIDTRGRARILFPERGWDDGFVRGGRTMAIPGRGANYKLQVQGPPGVERIVAFVSDEPLMHRWRPLLDDDLRGDAFSEKPRIFRSGAYVSGAYVSDGGVELSFTAGTRGQVKPKLVPVPVDDCPVFRDETWFRVEPRRGRRW